MRPVTDTCPKSMLPVAGKPFLHYQLDLLAAQGITEVVYCLGYRGEMIREYVGDGRRWGLKATYVDEGSQLRGTAGAIRLALDEGILDPVFALLYGDSFTRVSIAEVWASFERSFTPALMTVIRNDGQWDRSNAIYENGRVISYNKSLRNNQPSVRYIDYGFSILTRATVATQVPPGEASDLAALFHGLSVAGRLAGFEATDRFYEVGSPAGLKDFEEYIRQRQTAPTIRTLCPHGKTGILGGGLAGLTVAAHLETECEVLEADERLGGHCQSVREAGFTYDAGGPHIMFSRNQQVLDLMVSLLGDNVYRGRRNNKIFYKGRYVKYPFENGLNELDPQDRFECLYHYVRNDHPSPKNFREWMYYTFGTGLTEKYLLPYNEKIWNVRADQMSLDWVEGRVPKPPVEDVIRAAVGLETEGYTHQLHFYYPSRGGIESLPRGMAQRVRNVTTEFLVRSVRPTATGWLVSDCRQERHFDRLVSTMPIHEMAQIVEGVPEDVKRCVNALRYNSLFTVTVGLAS